MKRMSVAVVVAMVVGLLWATTPPTVAADEDDAYFSSMITAKNKTFYPLVKEGFKDSAVFELDSEEYWKLRATVYNENGREIRSLRTQSKCGDTDCNWWYYQWTWNGKKDDGTHAKKGAYEVVMSGVTQVEVNDEWVDKTVTASRSVVLDGGYMKRKFIEERRGTDTTSRSKGRGCYFDSYRRSLEMACWRGTYAKATWKFKIPANAKRVRKALFGPSGYDHGGVLEMRGSRTNARTYVISAKLTKWRQEFFDEVQVRYTRRVRV